MNYWPGKVNSRGSWHTDEMFVTIHGGGVPCRVLEVARIASKAAAKILVLTHMYGQIDVPGIRERIIRELSQICDGVIILGEDLMDISLVPPSLAKFQ